MKPICRFAAWIVGCALGVSAYGATAPLNQDSLNVIKAQLEHQNGLVGACTDVQLSLKSEENPVGQSTSILEFHFVSPDKQTYDYKAELAPSANMVGNFDDSGTGSATIYQSDSFFAIPVSGLTYTKGQITGLSWIGMAIGACSP